MNLKLALASSLLLGMLGACDSQVDGDHQGTALATLEGSVRNKRTLSTPDAEVVVIWHKTSGSPDLVSAEAVEVAGSFPTQFKLSLYEPPAPEVLNDWEGIRFGVAYIIAGAEGTDYTADDAAILGIEDDRLLVYVPEDVPAGTQLATVLRSTPRAGFHLFGVHKVSDAEREQRIECYDGLPANATLQDKFTMCGGSITFDDFVPLSTNLDTPLEIELVDDLDQVEFPEWT